MADTELTAADNFKYRIPRDTIGFITWFRESWRSKCWFRRGRTPSARCSCCGRSARDLGLPDGRGLLRCEPPLTTMVRGAEGEIVEAPSTARRTRASASTRRERE